MIRLIDLSAISKFRRKNYIINGNFDFWQRGTSLSSQTTDKYLADRFLTVVSGSSYVPSRESFTLGQTDVPNNPVYFFRNVVTTAGGIGDFCGIEQRVEGVRTLAGKTVTCSFWAKSDSNKNISFEAIQFFGTGGTPSADVNGISVTTLSLTTSWQKFDISFDLPSISGKTLGSDLNDYVKIRLWFDAGSNFDSRTNSLGNQSGTFDIAQVQLEEGSAASDFAIYELGKEFELCLRYFETQGQTCVFSYDSSLNSSAIYRSVSFYTPKRSTPTLTLFDQVGNIGVVSYWQGDGVTNNQSTFNTNVTSDKGIIVRLISLSNGRGLIFGFKADAEL